MQASTTKWSASGLRTVRSGWKETRVGGRVARNNSLFSRCVRPGPVAIDQLGNSQIQVDTKGSGSHRREGPRYMTDGHVGASRDGRIRNVVDRNWVTVCSPNTKG